MRQNNFNRLSTYEQVYKRLQVMVNKYLISPDKNLRYRALINSKEHTHSFLPSSS